MRAIIVSDKEREQYAHHLSQLIACKDDEGDKIIG
jgi:hypothetical protein